MTQAGDLIELTLPARVEYIGVARLMVSGVANRLGFPYDDIEDIKLSVAEACTNAVRHAYQGAEGKVRIQCGIFADRLEITISDNGEDFNLDAIRQERGPITKDTDIENLSEGGLGLYLIHTLMDEVEISGEQGITVAMTKYVRRDEVTNHVETCSQPSK
ncbi:anti-sigma B factor RsbW [Brevibacillus dissolubilis]|uniref:anti-sigma B factor RsbW n=1 Tax=Brevibacillus dissolubilis TaxID=1844116 RepID=UPI001115C116|nr:anti-sigma B factor RsbW [Brevibacillus dissolubilis]